VLGCQASGVTPQGEVLVVRGEGVMAGGDLVEHQRFCSGIWTLHRLVGCF
jgi:hypothetical protein